MAKYRQIKNSLLGGEISPSALGRTDLPQYPVACKLLRNMIPIPSGGAYRRPGTFYETELARTGYYAPRLLQFIYSDTEAYCLYLGWQAGQSTGFVDGFRATSNVGASTSITCTGSHLYRPTDTTYLSTFGIRYDEAFEVQYVQSADVMYLAHARRKPKKITRTASNTFTITDFDNGLTGASLRDAYPYLAQNTTATTIYSSAVSGSGVTLTASVAGTFTGVPVGTLYKIDDGAGTVGCAKLTAIAIGGTTATADVIVNFGGSGAGAARATWWRSAWGGDSTTTGVSVNDSWPRSVCFYQGRLAWGGCRLLPDSIIFSETFDYAQLSVSTIVDPVSSPTGSQPFTATLASEQLNVVQGMSAGETLLVRTSACEWVVGKADPTAGFGADNANADVQSSYGSTYLQAPRINSEAVLPVKSGHEIRVLTFNDLEKAYVATPVQLLYDEFPKPEVSNGNGNRRFRQIAWDSTRSTLWCIDTEGNLRGLTYDRQIGIGAWHSHQLGGYDSETSSASMNIDVGGGGIAAYDPAYFNCAGSVISIAVVPNPIIGFNDIWMVVKRYINSAWVYQFERMIGGRYSLESAYDINQHSSGDYLTDASVVSNFDYPGAEDDTFTGLSHLIGKVPYGIASNAHGLSKVYGSAVNGSGETTLAGTHPHSHDNEITTCAWGLPFDAIVQPVRLEGGSQIGTAMGAVKRHHAVTVKFHRTMQAKIGRDSSGNLEQVIFRTGSQAIGLSAELYSDDKEVKLDGTYDKDGYVYILNDQPLPFAVLAVIFEGNVYD